VRDSNFQNCGWIAYGAAGSTVTLVDCVLDAPPMPGLGNLVVGAGNVITEGPFTPISECATLAFAVCTMNGDCNLIPPQTPWPTAIQPVGCVGTFLTGFQGRLVETSGASCCVDCVFSYLTAARGGCCDFTGSASATFEHCAFLTSSSSTGTGGAIFLQTSGTTVISHCCAQGLRATADGAFVYHENGGPWSTRVCNIYWCLSGSHAAGIRSGGTGHSEYTNFTRCRAAGGTFGGGAFYLRAAQVETFHHLLFDSCSAAKILEGVVKQYAAWLPTTFNFVVFIRGDATVCVDCETNTVILVDTQFINCRAYFQTITTATISLTRCMFDYGPISTTTGITVIDCGYQPGMEPSVQCFLPDRFGATWGCQLAIVCPETTGVETRSESGFESPTRSDRETLIETVFETPLASNRATRTETRTRTPLESLPESAAESELASNIASVEASPTISPIVLPAGTTLPESSWVPSASSEPPSESGVPASKSGGGSQLWAVAVGIVCLVVGEAVGLLVWRCYQKPAACFARKEEARSKKASSNELDATHESLQSEKHDSVSEPGAVPKEEITERPHVSSSAKGWSSGAREPGPAAAPDDGPDFDDDSDGAEGGRGKHRKGGVEVIEEEAVNITSTVGVRATTAIPLKKKLWTRRQIRAHFEPEHAELWLSSNKASIEPGATEFPFTLFFEPTEAGSFAATLIVSFGDFEVHVPIYASTEGARRRRRHRSE
jgi:hypothetical protein